MRTTIDLPDELTRKAKRAAIDRGVSLKTLVTRALERDLDPTPARPPVRDPEFPLIPSRRPGHMRLSPRQIKDILLREEAAAYEVARRR